MTDGSEPGSPGSRRSGAAASLAPFRAVALRARRLPRTAPAPPAVTAPRRNSPWAALHNQDQAVMLAPGTPIAEAVVIAGGMVDAVGVGARGELRIPLPAGLAAAPKGQLGADRRSQCAPSDSTVGRSPLPRVDHGRIMQLLPAAAGDCPAMSPAFPGPPVDAGDPARRQVTDSSRDQAGELLLLRRLRRWTRPALSHRNSRTHRVLRRSLEPAPDADICQARQRAR
jgi:hypothetical protein